MKTWKKIAAVMMALAMVLGFAACGNKDAGKSDGNTDSDLAYVQDKGEMVIGYTLYEPMNYEDENGKLTGFDTEFAEAVCKKLGVTPKFVVIDWDNKFMELDAKSIDCIWNGMTITDEVKLNTKVTKPYVKNAQVVVMKKADGVEGYNTVELLKGLKFAAEASSAGEAAIKDLGLDEDYVGVSAQTDAMLEVMSGSVDACVVDITLAKAMTGEGSSYKDLTTTMELTSEEYGIGFRKDSDITEKVNGIIDELMQDGTLDKLAEKYELTLDK